MPYPSTNPEAILALSPWMSLSDGLVTPLESPSKQARIDTQFAGVNHDAFKQQNSRSIAENCLPYEYTRTPQTERADAGDGCSSSPGNTEQPSLLDISIEID